MMIGPWAESRTANYAPGERSSAGVGPIIARHSTRVPGGTRRPRQGGFTMTDSTENARDKLVDEFSAVLAEAEEMLKRAATETGDKARDPRSQIETKLLRAKLSLQELEGQAVDQAKAAARATDDYVHDKPWQAIGIAAARGFLIRLANSTRCTQPD